MTRPSCSTCKWSKNVRSSWGKCTNPDLTAFDHVKGHYEPELADAVAFCRHKYWEEIPAPPAPEPKRISPLLWALLKPFIGDVK